MYVMKSLGTEDGGLYGQMIYQWKEKCLNFHKRAVVKVTMFEKKKKEIVNGYNSEVPLKRTPSI